MSGTAQPRPERAAPPPPPPRDPPMVPFAVGGMVVWALAGLAAIPLREAHRSWPWICLAGFLWGIPGLAVMLRHDANRRRRLRRRNDAQS